MDCHLFRLARAAASAAFLPAGQAPSARDAFPRPLRGGEGRVTELLSVVCGPQGRCHWQPYSVVSPTRSRSLTDLRQPRLHLHLQAVFSRTLLGEEAERRSQR